MASVFIKAGREKTLLHRHPWIFSGSIMNVEGVMEPGRTVDVLSHRGDFLVCQFLSAGAEYWKNEILRQLTDLVPHCGIYERSDLDVREKEGLRPNIGPLCGQEPPDLVEIKRGRSDSVLTFVVGTRQAFISINVKIAAASQGFARMRRD